MSNINRLVEIFSEKKIYNREIAEFIGKSESTVSLWVNNRRQPLIEDLHKIAEYLRVDIRDLFHPSDWSNSKVAPFKTKKKG